MALSRCRFWLSDIRRMYQSMYGEDLCKQQNGNGWNKHLHGYLNEYSKFYILNQRSGHTEYTLLWRVIYDEERCESYLKWNTELREKICARHMNGGCKYNPKYFCPWIHVDRNLVSMIHTCGCRNSMIDGKCTKYHLKAHHLVCMCFIFFLYKDNNMYFLWKRLHQ